MKNPDAEIAELLQAYRHRTLGAKALLTSGCGRIYIHGAGNFGTAACNLLRDAGILPEGFLDRNGGNNAMHLSLPVHNVNAQGSYPFDKEKDVVIIAYSCSGDSLKAAKSAYHEQGFRNVLYFLDVYALLVSDELAPGSSGEMSVASGIRLSLKNISERIFRVAALLADDESLRVFRGCILSVLSGDPEFFVSESDQPQYFVTDIPFRKGYGRFVDCGAFDGDTAAALLSHKGPVQALACFEPDNSNFRLLSAGLKNQRAASEQILLPCGVWDRTEMLRFRSGTRSTCGISESGDTYIQCVAIDEVIADFSPTFLKMDVEGAEYEALLGAKALLTGGAPDLAISVYHRMDHIWEIPLLVKGMNEDYDFYLRSHGPYGIETIMYAVCK